MRCSNVFIGFFLLLNCFTSYAQLPSNYQDLSAQEKQELIWKEVLKSHDKEPLPPLVGNTFVQVLLKLKGLFNLSPTFDHNQDELPQGRVKIIHANGVVGKVSFIPVPNHPFSGFYQNGGVGLVRLSLAVPPTNSSFIPGMAIKLFISQNPSVNLQVMNLLEGQKENWNFFAKDFSNQIPHPTSWTLTAIEKIFEWTRSPANDLPLWHLAAWTSEGRANQLPVYPERLYFNPSSQVINIIPEDSRRDFRVSLLQIPTGPLYEVFGIYRGKEYHVGTLVLESQLLASNYGDNKLFFQHQR